MSHFTVMVALDKSVDLSRDTEGNRPALQFALDQVLERFNDGREVEPYREYLTETPETFWWTEMVRRKRDHYVNGTGLVKYDPTTIGYSTASSNKTNDQQRAEQLKYKQWAELLDNIVKHSGALTWLDVITAYERWKRHTGDGSESVFYDEEKDQVYTLNTYNPQSKWDWWQIGGRWAGKFHPTPEFNMEEVLFAKLGQWNSPEYDDNDIRIDGGRVKYIDFERKRDEAGAKALADYREYHALVAEHGEGYQPWSHYLGLTEAEQLDISEARRLYREQPLRVALNKSETFKWHWGSLDEEMGVPEEECVSIARRGAVTGYSFITKAGVWMEPGEMGWFGMSSDTPSSREAYDVEVNTYLNNLDPDDILVVLDLHI